VGNFNRPWSGNYGGWYNGGWGGWNRYPGVWGRGLAAAGLAAGATDWGDSGAFEYANPYYEAPVVTEDSTTVAAALDYSQPIAVPTPAEVADTDAVVVNDGMDDFSRARTSFMDGMYGRATTEVEQALKRLPGDRTIHEFRALCLFARKRYRESSAALYAVLVAGPGWDWTTMSALYPDNDTYTKQLRALETYVKDNPKDAKGHFLLGYHYLVLDDRDAAREELSLASKLQPKDKLSAQLAAALAPAESSDKD
jgi:tetratricopeptide (TPR) repeat protein